MIPNYKMQIQLNKEKIVSEGKYEIVEIINTIDEIFFEAGMKKENREDNLLVYYVVNDKDDLSNMGIAAGDLEDSDWFLPICSQWLWLRLSKGEYFATDVINDGSIYEADDVLEDLRSERKVW